MSFSSVNWSEQPTLVLKNLDGTFIQPLTYAFDISAELHYNETSQLEFSIPAYVNGKETPHYQDVVGMRLIDWIGVGQFILVNPTTENDGIKEIKKCKAYSLEYELTYKTTYIPEGTYELWNPLARESTIIGMILADYPSWHPGYIDADLTGVYRTFEANSQNAYDLMKNELQDKYQCVFDFDTYSRSINVRKVSSLVAQRPVYLSVQNLVKNIKLEEDTENIFTVMDVNGAEGVDIRSVNPLGGNAIYNLDYFMHQTEEEAEAEVGNSYFSQAMIDKWNEWKETVGLVQEQYYDITIDKVLKEAKLEMAKAELTDLSGELSTLTELQSTYVEAAAQGVDKSSDLTRIKAEIAAKETEITAKKTEIATIEASIEQSSQQQKTINDECKFDNFFDEGELLVLDRYFKQTSIAEDSFVYQQVNSYADADTSKQLPTASINISDAKISGRDMGDGKAVYMVTGGNLVITKESDAPVVSAKIIRGSLEKKSDNSYLMTAYLNGGTYTDVDAVAFESAGITIYGAVTAFDTDVQKEHGQYIEGTYIDMSSSNNGSYFTRNVGEYEKRSVEWSLLEFGTQELEALSWPTYTFDIDAANFLALKDFAAFKNQFALGDKVYVDIDGKILTPIAIGVQVDFSDLSKFKLIFGDKYSLKDSAFELVDLLEQSVQMGKTVAANKLSYSAFIDSGASTAVKDYMTSALDASKQAVISGANQAVQFDGSGLRLRKAVDGGYDDEQIWMINNNIVFTDDGWSSAKMALGKFTDDNIGECWGLVAPNIVGTLLAGENLVIESAKRDGTTAVFRVDADGAKLYNSHFDLVKALQVGSNAKAWIKFDPNLGMIGGQDSIANPLYEYDEDGNVIGVIDASGDGHATIPSTITENNMPNASFWLDMNGNAFYKGSVYAEDGVFRGTVYATDGEFTGTVYATDGEFSGTIKASKLIGNLEVDDGEEGWLIGAGIKVGPNGSGGYNFVVDGNGNVTMPTGTISFGDLSDAEDVQGEIDSKTDEDDVNNIVDGKIPKYVKSTYIDFRQVSTPQLYANDATLYGALKISDSSSAKGYIGAATGNYYDWTSGKYLSTSGIAVADSATWDSANQRITWDTNGNYMIVTDSGARLQSSQNSIYVTSGIARMEAGGHKLTVSSSGAFYDDTEIGSGYAVFS